MTVWVYVDTSKQVGDRDHIKSETATTSRSSRMLNAAETWFEENDPWRGLRV
jgi:hypothetical protein